MVYTDFYIKAIKGYGCSFRIHPGNQTPLSSSLDALTLVEQLSPECQKDPDLDGSWFLRFWENVAAQTNHASTAIFTTANSSGSKMAVEGYFPQPGCEFVMPLPSILQAARSIVRWLNSTLRPPFPYDRLLDVMVLTHPTREGAFRWKGVSTGLFGRFADSVGLYIGWHMLATENISGSSSKTEPNIQRMGDERASAFEQIVQFWNPQQVVGFKGSSEPFNAEFLLYRS